MRSARTRRRHHRLALLLVAVAVGAPAMAAHGPPHTTGPRSCEPVRGTFTNLFLMGPLACPQSPINLCTVGALTGDLEADYAFTFTSQEPVAPPAPVSRFTGESVIDTEDGQIFGTDFGLLRVTQPPLAGFTTHLRVTGGTGAYEGASGQLTIQGTASFATGEGGGTWVGVICTPREPGPPVARRGEPSATLPGPPAKVKLRELVPRADPALSGLGRLRRP